MPLPPGLVRKRVENEIALVRALPGAGVSDVKTGDFPLQFTVRLKGVPGPVWKEGAVVDRLEHELLVAVTEGYPEQKPVVRWKTPIFHPNIMHPDDGGYVCTALLDQWNFRSTLATFLQAVEVLLASPNPDAPYDTDSCTRAAMWFRKHPYRPDAPTRPPARDRPTARPAEDRK